MNRMKTIITVTALCLAAVCVLGGEKEDGVYVEPKTGVMFPLVLGGMAKGKATTYKEASLGVSIKYSGTNGIVADVYLYDGGLTSIPAGTNSATVKDELKKSSSSITAMEKAGLYKGVKELGEVQRGVGSGAGGRRMIGMSLEYTITREGEDGQAVLSHLYIVGYKGLFLKIRATFPKANRESCEKSLESFLNDLGNLL
ncbi:MAG: hypothetical protein C0404_03505 [Verrucomicrobia bacterium]|nr:hypothetical protein [Verrucomicrobiota bacterium]